MSSNTKRGKKTRKRERRLAHALEYAVLRVLLWVLHWLPWGLINTLARGCALLHAPLLPVRRGTILYNLKIALPERTERERRRIARQVPYHSLLFIAELAKLQGMPREKIIARALAGVRADAESLGKLKALKESGHGFLMATGHFGNWECIGAWTVQKLGQVAVVYKPLHNPRVDALMKRIRTEWGEVVISTRERAPRLLIQTLRSGKAVALVADQDARKQGEMIPFFGRPASTATGLAWLAIRLRVPILICFAIRERPGLFRFEVRRVEWADPNAPVEVETQRLMEVYNTELERVIREYPEQYFWWHNRWKTQRDMKN